jgi:hypothetical protein
LTFSSIKAKGKNRENNPGAIIAFPDETVGLKIFTINYKQLINTKEIRGRRLPGSMEGLGKAMGKP